MKKNRNPTTETLLRSEIIFEQTCQRVLDALGSKPFHVRAGLNAAVFDAVMVAFSNHLEVGHADISNRYKRLINDKEFDKNTRQATTDVDTIRQRFTQAEPPRVLRRLQPLREWSHEQVKQVFP